MQVVSNKIQNNIFSILKAILVIEFFLGYYLSTINLKEPDNVAYAILYWILGVLFAIGGLFTSKLKKSDDITELQEGSRNIKEDYLLLFLNNIKDNEGKVAIKIALSVLFCTLIYILTLVFIILVNVNCKNVGLPIITVVLFICLLIVALNQSQIILTSKRKFFATLISNGFLIASLILYVLVEWVYLPVTLNLPLLISCLLLLTPIHIKYGVLCKVYFTYYKK